MTTSNATPSLAKYRERHVIQVDESGDRPVCTYDGITVSRVVSRRWQHDMNQIARLHVLDVYVSEIADDEMGQAKAAAELEDDDWTDRESQPEFNGAFR